MGQLPRRFADVLVPHLPLAFFSGMLLLVSAVVPLEKMPLIPCWFNRLTGYPCLFCGMTRSFTDLGHGQVRHGVLESPAGAILFAVTAVVFVVNAYALLTRKRISPQLPSWLTGTRLAWSAVVILLMNWIYRIAAGMD